MVAMFTVMVMEVNILVYSDNQRMLKNVLTELQKTTQQLVATSTGESIFTLVERESQYIPTMTSRNVITREAASLPLSGRSTGICT